VRAFIAIDVPAEVKDKVEDLKYGIAFPGLAFVRREAVHLTLLFLGEISEEDAGRVAEAMRLVEFRPFKVALKGVSCFSPDFIKIVFVEVKEGAAELLELRQKLCDALSTSGIKFDGESFTPHLTVARAKRVRDRQELLRAINERAQTDFGSFEARSVVLKKSVLGANGPVYTDLLELKLQPDAA
jgi:RNA 2',3'-cyclic 3'-phosphodiesterase